MIGAVILCVTANAAARTTTAVITTITTIKFLILLNALCISSATRSLLAISEARSVSALELTKLILPLMSCAAFRPFEE